MAVYKGFSTVGKTFPPFTLTDIELIKADLMATFNTNIGERVMMPNFGCAIQGLIMDPLDNITRDIVKSEVKKVVSVDPRVALIGSPILIDLEHAIRIDVELYFIQQDTAEKLILEFQRTISEDI